MSQKSIDVVRSSLDAANAGNDEAALAALADGAEWHVAKEHPESRVCRGRDEVGAYFEEWRSQLTDMRFDLPEMRERGDRVLAAGTIRGVGAAGTVDVAVPLAIIYTVRDGQIVKGEEFLDPERAAEAFDADG